ncbi:MAG TPA: ScyD/ScyE family protein [Acidimicrobiales bacterium]|nr:ScyD/ScyE family protein [Acidimicrobiales bacterium]
MAALTLVPTTVATAKEVAAKDAVTGKAPGSAPEVVATGLDNPRKMVIGPDGALYVAESGKGGDEPCAGGEMGSICYGETGAITRIAEGKQTRVLEGLPSAAEEGGTSFAGGPVALAIRNGRLDVLMMHFSDADGSSAFGEVGEEFGQLVSATPGSDSTSWKVGPDFADFEVRNNPDQGAAAGEGEPPLNSNPYAITPFRDGYAVADAGGNDVLYVDGNGLVTVLAVLPTQKTTIPADSFGPGEPPEDTEVDVQPVPTSVAVGPDGALYVGELAGLNPGLARVWKIVPGQSSTVVAGGFNPITDLAFDRQGRLLVLELTDGFGPEGPGPGALIRIEPDGNRTTLAKEGLVFPGGLAVGGDGSVYVSNFGVFATGGDGEGPPPGMVLRIPVPSGNPYRFVASDGGIFTFGGTGFYGSTGDLKLNQPIVGMASNPLRPGYWLVASDGGIFTFGDAVFHGSTGDIKLNQPIVGMEPTPDGRGYWLVASDGGIFTFGNAPFLGSTGDRKLNKPIIGMSVAPDGNGYWLFASDGGVFTFGSADFFGSTGAMTLNKPIVGSAPTPDGEGYWLVASDGGIFTFGTAGFFGSTGDRVLNSPVVSIVPTESGKGYALIAADGGVFNFGDSAFHGSTGNLTLNKPIVGADLG